MSVPMLPSEWARVRISDVATVSRGASPRPIASARWFSDNSEVGWVRISDLGRSDGLTLKTTTQRLSQDGIARSRFLPPGTLIMSIAATVGVPIITGIPACIHDGFVALERLRGVDQMYLLYALKSLEDELRSAGQTGSQANVNTEIVNGLLVNLPPEPEQKRIAEALRDTDNQIAALKSLVMKKQAISQGMMQQLLSGKTRLSGFSQPWQAFQLGDVARIKTGTRNNQDKKPSGRYPFFVRSATVERIDTFSYDCEAILIPGEGGIGSIFHYINGKFEVHQRVYAISHFNSGVSGKFVYFYLRQFFGPHAMENSVKATVDSLRLPTFKGFRMTMPARLDEQEAIVAALSDCADEIELLNTRLAKARDLKQGMMQELLTGRTRLLVGKPAG